MTLLKINQPKRYGSDWMGEFFNDLPSAFGKTIGEESFLPKVNINETNDAYVLQVSAPGRTKEDFKISLEKNLLTISSEKKDEQQTENEKQIRREFSFQSFKRTFTVDEKIDAEKIDAKYENGLLTLTLPKKEEVKLVAKTISVQ